MPLTPDKRSTALRDANSQLAERAVAIAGGVAVHRPVHVYLQVASACNLDCYMCSEHNRPESERYGRGLRSMAPEIFAKVESEVFPWSTRTYIGVGGEPTIAPRFTEYVRRAARAGQEIHLVTNGTRLDKAELAEVVANDVAHLFVSLDAATPATYERIRRGARWDKTIEGLRRLRGLRAQAAHGGCRLTLSFVLMRSNVRELPAFVDLARELGASEVHAQHVIPVNEEGRVESLFDDMELYSEARSEAQRRADAHAIRFEAPQPFPHLASPEVRGPSAARPTDEALEPELARASGCALPQVGPPVPCRLPTSSFVVLYDGRVFPCCHPFAHQKLQIGDLRTQSVAEIWNGRLIRNLRAGLPLGDAPEICRNCSAAHDPPPGREDPVALASSQDLAAYYGKRDLAPLGLESGVQDLIDGTGLSAYVEDLRRHSSSLEAERVHMAGHIANLEAERVHLVGHIANLEPERAHLFGHIANLERELADLRTRWTLKQRLVLRLRRLLGRSTSVRRTSLPDEGRA